LSDGQICFEQGQAGYVVYFSKASAIPAATTKPIKLAPESSRETPVYQNAYANVSNKVRPCEASKELHARRYIK